MSERKAASIQEVSEALGLHPQTVRRLIREGRLQAVHVGRRWLIPYAAVDRFLERPKRPYRHRDVGPVPVGESRRAADVIERLLGDGPTLPPPPPPRRSL